MDELVPMLRHVLGRHNDDGVPVVELVRRLAEGYDLLAEAVEAREEYLTLANSPYPTGSEGEALKREYDEERLIEKARKCHNAALDHLRGVAGD